MRTLFRSIHLYGGLVCSAYLLVFGVSSLDFNHRFDCFVATPVVEQWQQIITGPPYRETIAADDPEARKAARLEYARTVRAELGLFGNVAFWENRVGAGGVFHTEINRPARHYEIDIKNGVASVKKTSHSNWRMVIDLHGWKGVPRAPFASTWKWYTEITTWFVVFMAASGVFLWTFRRSERRLGLGTLIGVGGAVTGWFVYIIAVG